VKYKVGDKFKCLSIDELEDIGVYFSNGRIYCSETGNKLFSKQSLYGEHVITTCDEGKYLLNKLDYTNAEILSEDILDKYFVKIEDVKSEKKELIWCNPSNKYIDTIKTMNTLEELNEKRLKVFIAKNDDYNKGVEPTKSFARSGAIVRVKASDYVRQMLTQKLSRLEGYMNQGSEGMKVTDENISDTVIDIVSYCAIYEALANGLTGDDYVEYVKAWRPFDFTERLMKDDLSEEQLLGKFFNCIKSKKIYEIPSIVVIFREKLTND